MTSTTSETWRTRLAEIVDGAPVQNFVLVVIVINAVTMGLETMALAGSTFMTVLHVLDTTALTIFVIEIAVKLVALGPVRFFKQGWNVFDFLVVAVALIPGSGPLAVLRTLRVLRILRVIKFFPQLRTVVEALMRALPGIGAIAMLMLLIYYVSAVMATVLFGEQYPDLFGHLVVLG